MKPKMIAVLSAGVLGIIILLQNTQVVTLRFLFWKIEMSGIIFLPLVTLAGFAIGYLMGKESRGRI